MRIALLTLPFLHPQYPSLGLTQLKGRVKEIFKDQVEIRLFYLNHEFYKYFGKELYMAIDADATYTSLNDWVFYHEAFDQVKSNFDEYLKRFYPHRQFNRDAVGKLMNLGDFIIQVIREYQLSSYDIIGINAAFATLPGLAFGRHLKKIKKEIITIMGGAAVSEDMGEALIRYYPYIDYICSGPGLISFPRLIDGIMKNDETARESIGGIFSKNNTRKVGKTGEVLEINEDIHLDYGDFFESFYKFNLDKELEPVVLMETSRGCYWNRCKFCGLNEGQKKYQVKRPGKAIEEINGNFQKYNCHIQMVDNIMPRSYVKEVLPHLRVPGGRHLRYEVKADYNKEEMEILNQAKVKRIQPGIESLATSVHEVINKGINSFQCINMLKHCVQLGIIPGWNLIVGFPGVTGEMYEELLSIIPLLAHLFPPTVLTPVRFDRYSIYWREKEKYDLDLVPFSTYQYLYPYGNEFLAKIAYYFEDIKLNSQRILLMSKYYSRIETLVNKWKKRWKIDNINEFPRLTCRSREGSPYIFDSRQEIIKEYPVSTLEEKILILLETPMAIDPVKINFPTEPPGNIIEALDNLVNQGLIIKENDRYLGLIIRNYSDNAIRFILENRR